MNIFLLAYQPVSGSFFYRQDGVTYFCEIPFSEELQAEIPDFTESQIPMDFVPENREFESFPELEEYVENQYLEFRNRSNSFEANKEIMKRVQRAKQVKSNTLTYFFSSTERKSRFRAKIHHGDLVLG